MRNCYLITGATSGLEKNSYRISKSNYSVIISGRNKRKLEKF